MSQRRIDCPGCGQSIDVPLLDVTSVAGPPTEAMLPPTLHSSSSATPLDATMDSPASSPSRTVVFDAGTLPTIGGRPDRGNLRIAGHEVLSELGRGGMGVVYLARQRAVNRLVALKMILSAEHAGTQDVVRFRAEAEAVAQLDHPNIVHIFEVGEHDGRPFFTLEYVDGGSLEKQLDGTPRPPQQSAALIETLARAVHHAHEHGIIHRDLKPANVLLQFAETKSPEAEPDGGAPQSAICNLQSAIPKITDFGLAKQRDSLRVHTQSGAILGTPSYMAPEQAASKRKDIGPACDIYALGAILYEMLTGRPPFKAETPVDTIMQVVTQEPVAPRRLVPAVPSDLETICLKCLQKEPWKRYDSAGDLADDLRRFLEGEPIVARPAGWIERAVKWTKRRPAVAALSAIIVVLLIAAFALVTWLWQDSAQQGRVARRKGTELAAAVDKLLASQEDLKHARAEALERAKDAEANNYFNSVALAYQLWKSGDGTRAQQTLQACPRELRGWEWQHLRHEIYPDAFTHVTNGAVVACALSPDGQHVAAITSDRKLRVISSSSHSVRFAKALQRAPSIERLALAFHPSGNRLAWCDLDHVYQCEMPTGKMLPTKSAPPDARFASLTYTPDGRLLGVALKSKRQEWGKVEVWDLDRQTLLGATSGLKGQGQVVLTERAVAVSADGKKVAVLFVDSGVRNTTFDDVRPAHDPKDDPKPPKPEPREPEFTYSAPVLKVWDVASGKEQASVRVGENLFNDIAFSPDGKRVACGNGPVVQEITLSPTISPDLPATPRTLTTHQSDVFALTYTADGRFLASVGDDRIVRIWDVAAGMERFALRGQSESGFAIGCNGERLVTGGGSLFSSKGEIKVWPTLASLQNDTYLGTSGQVALCSALKPDGRRFMHLSIAQDPGKDTVPHVAVRDREANVDRFPLPMNRDVLPLFGVFDPTGKYVAVWGSNAVLLLDAETGKQQASLPCRGTDNNKPEIGRLTFTADGKKLVAARVLEQRNNRYHVAVTIWDVATRKRDKDLQSDVPFAMPFGENPRALLIGLGVKGLRKLPPGLLGGAMQPFAIMVTGLAIRGDGQQIAVGLSAASRHEVATELNLRGTACVWDLPGGERHPIIACDHVLYDVAYRPNGQLLTMGGRMTVGEAALWDVASGKKLQTFRGHTRNIATGIFTPDGRRLITAGIDNALKIWDPDTGREVLTLEGHTRPPTLLTFADDGKALVSATGLDFMDLLMGIGVIPSSMRRPVEIRVWRTLPLAAPLPPGDGGNAVDEKPLIPNPSPARGERGRRP